MLHRFRKIDREFGRSTVVRLAVLLIGLGIMAAMGWGMFDSPWASIIAVGGLAAGFLCRHWITLGVSHYHVVIPAGLFVYGLVLFAGKRLGIEPEMSLLIITLTTVVVFDLQFWSLSDPTVAPIESRSDSRSRRRARGDR